MCWCGVWRQTQPFLLVRTLALRFIWPEQGAGTRLSPDLALSKPRDQGAVLDLTETWILFSKLAADSGRSQFLSWGPFEGRVNISGKKVLNEPPCSLSGSGPRQLLCWPSALNPLDGGTCVRLRGPNQH